MNKQEIEKAINHLTMLRRLDSGEKKKLYDVAISALQQQLTNGWIPTSQKLPDSAGYYMGTVKFEDNSTGVYPVWWHHGIRTDYTWELDTSTPNANVIAWQPLPEPYKEVSE